MTYIIKCDTCGVENDVLTDEKLVCDDVIVVNCPVCHGKHHLVVG